MMRRLLLLLLAVTLSGMVRAEQGLTEDYGPVVAQIVRRGEAALAGYAEATAVPTGNEFSRLYFDVFESSGMEFTLNLKDSSLLRRIESGFSLIISQAMRGEPRAELDRTWAALRRDLDGAVARYSSGGATTGFRGRVLQSFLILLREGVEAMLVVAALVAYLRRSGFADKVRVIWWGGALALVASAGAAWLLHAVIRASGAGREQLEGATMLVAAAVLLYVSYWLTSKRDADRWQAFVRSRMDRALGRGSLFALGSVAFLAVFREGAETILFYQALMAGSAGQMDAIGTGMVLATVALAAVYGAVRLLSVRLPLRLFFSGTAVLLHGMAFTFAGQGVLELQVAGLLHTTPLPGWPVVGWLGLFPTVETVVAQAAVLAAIPLGWAWMRWAAKRAVAGAGAPVVPAACAAGRPETKGVR